MKKIPYTLIFTLLGIILLSGCASKDLAKSTISTSSSISKKALLSTTKNETIARQILAKGVNENELPTNLLPMYGGASVSKTEGQIRADQEFIKTWEEQFPMGGNGLFASYRISMGGDSALEDGEYDIAMRRYNQARLLDSRNPNIYSGFANILAYMGDEVQSKEYYSVALQKEEYLEKNIEPGYILGKINFNPQTLDEKQKYINEINKAIGLLDKSEKDYKDTIGFLSVFKVQILCELGNNTKELKEIKKILIRKYVLEESKDCLKDL